jgi:hypothetical protein
MKSLTLLLKPVLVLSLALFFALSLAPATSHSGGCSSTSNSCGGNFFATEFKDLMSDVISDLRQIRKRGPIVIEQLQKTGSDERADVLIDPEVLNKAFTGVSVVDNRLYIDGKLVDFRSNPESGHVDFTEKNWLSNSERAKRMRMVVHELLMLSSKSHPEFDDYLYNEQLSRKILDMILKQESQLKPCLSQDPPNAQAEMLGAQVQTIGEKVTSEIETCPDSAAALRVAPVHYKCATDSNALYEKVSSPLGESWKGPDGVVWGDVIGKFTHEDAKAACASRGGRLPAGKEFDFILKNGFGDKLPHVKNETFWANEEAPGVRYAKTGSTTRGSNYSSASGDLSLAVRCVLK